MRKKIDYSKLVKSALTNLKKINELAKKFSKYESTKSVQKEIDEILQVSDVSRYKGSDRETYTKMSDAFATLEEDLEEIDMLTSDTIKELNKLPEEARKDVYDMTGIDEIEQSDEGISEGRAELLHKMLALVKETTEESSRYFDVDREEYVEFEDEISK